MPSGVIGGLLAAALASVAEVLIFTGIDGPKNQAQRSTRVIAAAFVAGQASLGLIIAMLSAFTEDATISSPIAFASAALIAIGAFTIAITYRRGALSPGSGDPVRDRIQTVRHMALGEALGVGGAMLAITSLFVSAP
jgi:hypothetical protein